MIVAWDYHDETEQDQEEGNMCLNVESDDEKSLEVNKLNCC